jgi:PKD repeat protein
MKKPYLVMLFEVLKGNAASRFLTQILFTAILSFYFIEGNTQITKRMYLVGNSITDCINYNGLEDITLSRGNTDIWAREVILGSPLYLLWEDSLSSDGFLTSPYMNYPNAFDNYTWDCLSLEPFDSPITGSTGDSVMCTNYMLRAKKHNPNVQTYIYERWPRKPTDSVLTASLWNDLWLSAYIPGSYSYEKQQYFEDLRTSVASANTGMKAPCIVPVGRVMYEFNQKLIAGHLPNDTLKSVWNLYADGIHVNSVGQFLVGATFYATLYKDDPRGLAVPYDYGTINDATRDTILQTIFEVVFQEYPLSCNSMADLVPPSGVVINPTSLTLNVLQSYQLSDTVKPYNAENRNVSWSSANTNVAIVDVNGLVTAVDTGKTTITVRTNAGNYTASTQVTVKGALKGTTITGTLADWVYTSTGINDSIAAQNYLDGVSSAEPSLLSYVGPGITPGTYVGTGMYAWEQIAMTLETSIAGNEYFSFTVAPEASKLMSITNVSYEAVSQNRYRKFALFSSVNGFTADNVIHIDSANYINAITVPITGHINISEPVEFRVYVYNPVTSNPNQYEAVGIGSTTSGQEDFVISGSIFTPNNTGTTPPTIPTNLAVSQITETSLYLSWTPSTDSDGVVYGYNVFQDGVQIDTLVKNNSFELTGLTLGTYYKFNVKAVDFFGNSSDTSKSIMVMTDRPPTAVITANPLSGKAPLVVNFNANKSTDPDTVFGDYIFGFNWNFGDGTAVELSNNLQHTFVNPGNFTVTLKVVDSREAWSTPVTTMIKVEPTGITDFDQDAITLSPNPASSRIEIKGPEITDVKIFNISGILVEEKTTVDADDLNIDISSLSSGIYIVKITTETGWANKKIIVK